MSFLVAESFDRISGNSSAKKSAKNEPFYYMPLGVFKDQAYYCSKKKEREGDRRI